MDDSSVVIISGAFALAGSALAIAGKALFDRRRNGNGNGNGKTAVEQALSKREEIVFQTTMQIAMDGMKEIMNEAVGAMRGIHDEIKLHRESTAPAIAASLETRRIVGEIYEKLRSPHDVGKLDPR